MFSFTASFLSFFASLGDSDEDYSGSLNVHEMKEMLVLVEMHSYRQYLKIKPH